MTGSPPMVLPSAMASLCLESRKIGRGEQFAQIDGLAARVGQFDADGVAARHHGDAGGDRRHRAGDVVGEADHPRGFDARRRLEFVERHHRAGADVDDLAAHAEIVQHAFEQAGVLLQRVLRNLRSGGGLFRFGEQVQLREFVDPGRGAPCRAAPWRAREGFAGRWPAARARDWRRRARRPDGTARRARARRSAERATPIPFPRRRRRSARGVRRRRQAGARRTPKSAPPLARASS